LTTLTLNKRTDRVEKTNPLPAWQKLLDKLKAENDIIATDQPLAIGIHEQIKNYFGVSATQARRAMAAHTRTPAYRKNIRKGGSRFNLDGSVAGEITEAHREDKRDETSGSQG
jgi:sRNA-binding protein